MSVTEITIQDKIEALKLVAHDLPQVMMPTKHFLVDGMYARQIFIPSSTAFIGRRHKKFHYFMVLKGGAMVTLDDGTIGNFKPGMVFLCSPGSQRVGLTYEDTVFVTVHRSDSILLKDIEDDCVEYDSTSRYGVGNEILERLPKELL